MLTGDPDIGQPVPMLTGDPDIGRPVPLHTDDPDLGDLLPLKVGAAVVTVYDTIPLQVLLL